MTEQKTLEVLRDLYAGKREVWEEEVEEAIGEAIKALDRAIESQRIVMTPEK